MKNIRHAVLALTTLGFLLAFPGPVPSLDGVARASEGKDSAKAVASVTDIKVSFQLDPRLTRGLYMGDRWVSPPTYVGTAGQDTVMVRAEVLDARGNPTGISPEWVPADPEMVDVSPRQGKEVKITVRRAGQSALRVASPGFSRELTVKAAETGNVLQVEISQGQASTGKPPGKKKESAEERTQLAEKNRKEGEAFLAENAGKEGVVTLPSGLQYKILKEGAGKRPAGTDKVYVNYRGTFPDGTEFDNSRRKGKPAVVKVDRVIKGWSEALQLMKEGSTWMLYLPSDLAYGDRRPGTRIGPNQVLVFEVELLSVP